MGKKRRRYRDTYQALKKHQHCTSWQSDAVHDWEIDDMRMDSRGHIVNKRRRSRLGYIQEKAYR